MLKTQIITSCHLQEKIDFFLEPGGPRVRVDSGVCAGLSISPYYDSLIAKIVVRGRTRGDAIKNYASCFK